MFGLIVIAIIGPAKRGSDYEQKRAANRQTKLQAQREQDTAALTGYGWIDKNKGVVRLPIERAMELTLADLGRTMGISRETVRQIELAALVCLRSQHDRAEAAAPGWTKTGAQRSA